MAAGRKTGGRAKGTPNKATAGVKEALGRAFVGIGGVPALIEWAEANRDEFYKLWARMLPQEVKAEISGPNGGPLEVREVVVSTREEAARLFADQSPPG